MGTCDELRRTNTLILPNPQLVPSVAIPQPGKCNVSSTAVTFSNGSVVLLDAGEGTQQQLMRSKAVKIQKIDAILITHMHGDHFFGIFGLLATLSSMGRVDPVHVCGPAGIEAAVRSIMGFSDSFLPYRVVFHEADASLRAYPNPEVFRDSDKFLSAPSFASVKAAVRAAKKASQRGATAGASVGPTGEVEMTTTDLDSKVDPVGGASAESGTVATASTDETETGLPDNAYVFEQKPYSFEVPNLPGIKFMAIPIEHRVPCVGYVIEESERPGALDGKLAQQLGARGKQLGLLKSGQDVVLENGTTIYHKDVLAPPIRGRKFAFLQDTNDASFARPYINDCDVMIHECTYDASMYAQAIPRGHATTLMAADLAFETRSKTLILTHFSSRYTKEALVHDVANNRVVFRAPRLNMDAVKSLARKNVDQHAEESAKAVDQHRKVLNSALIHAGPEGSRNPGFFFKRLGYDLADSMAEGEEVKCCVDKDGPRTFYGGTPDDVSILQLQEEACMRLRDLGAPDDSRAYIAADFRYFEAEQPRNPDSPWVPREDADVEMDILLVPTLQEVEAATAKAKEDAAILEEAKRSAQENLDRIAARTEVSVIVEADEIARRNALEQQ